MLDGELSIGDYKAIKERYEPELRKLQNQIVELSSISADIKTYIDFTMGVLENLSQHYVAGNVHSKQLLLGSILSKKLVFENNQYRTIPFNEAVSLVLNVDKALEGTKKGKVQYKTELSVEVEDNGVEPMTSCMPCKRSTN